MVKSADRVFQVLDYVVGNKEGVTHKDLSKTLDIPKSSLSALLANLLSREFLAFDDVGKRYRLGPQILTLAGRYLAGLDIAQMGKPIVRRVMIETGESTELAVRRGEKIQIVCKEDCSNPIQHVIELGDRAPIYATAAGKSILAHLTHEDMEDYFSSVELKPITKKTVTDEKMLRHQLNEIRSGALAYSHEELNDGLIAMAAPVFNLTGNVVASIVVPIPILRFTKEKEKSIARTLKKSAGTLSHRLGFKGDTHGQGQGPYDSWFKKDYRKERG